MLDFARPTVDGPSRGPVSTVNWPTNASRGPAEAVPLVVRPRSVQVPRQCLHAPESVERGAEIALEMDIDGLCGGERLDDGEGALLQGAFLNEGDVWIFRGP